ncbi:MULTISPECIES: ThuA domain-containing protein [Dictyoglomus]|jgi:type 1 glutamine amidotransferase|uniref:ThuA-like domain-containing protein n=1 Tax=Dictyoglomus turgidum (strain DSM 6724 / Z-1310) TaxID=515635 RepID=B8E0A9_DICTD|nr:MULTISPECIES: ThuA domain-containing protein [Dictyoglomus]ACK42554.1 conserved hypothetical protein [Dictyoglomus turgidum DSM 6724]HBU32242.1 hypothetical protein [Dictyoglomus sp.]
MERVLAIVGDYYHPEEKIKETLEFVLKNTYWVDYASINNFSMLIREDPYLVIIGRENKLNPQDKNSLIWMDDEIENLLVDYVSNGGRLLVMHSGLASYDVSGKYVRELTRGYFKYHPERKMVKYYGRYPDKDKDIYFEIFDEHYFVEVDKESTNIFLYSTSLDGESVAGWYHEYGKGKILCLTPAHNEALANENLRKLLRDLILWM